MKLGNYEWNIKPGSIPDKSGRRWNGEPIPTDVVYKHTGSGYDPYEGMQQGYPDSPGYGPNGPMDLTYDDIGQSYDGRGDPGPDLNISAPVDYIASNGVMNPGYEAPPDSDYSGFGDFGSWLTNFLKTTGNSINNASMNPALIPAMATAWQYYNNADKYGDMGKSLREEGNPFGQYRQTYGEGLMDLYKDPSSLENSAAYQARMRAGLNTLGPQLAAKGGGFGNMGGEMIKYASDLASTEYDKEWQRRFNAAGGQFGPDASLRAQLDAAKLESDAKNAALGHIFAPFAPQPGGTTINNGTGGGGSGNGAPPGVTGSKYAFPPPGQIGATGTWGPNGTYKLKDGTVIDVAKLSEAARGGDQSAIEWLTRISGGATVDEQIRNLGVNFEGGDTGDPYNPYVPPIEDGPSEPYYPPDTSGGNLADIDLESWYDSRIGE